MFADLDDFKQVNDQYGHFLGDELLKQVGSRLRNSLREGDVVGRIGGDEFLIVLANSPSSEDCINISNNIFKAMQEKFSIGLQNINVNISLGSATYPEDTKHTNELLKLADQAMYTAKNKGKNCYIKYNKDLSKKIKRVITV